MRRRLVGATAGAILLGVLSGVAGAAVELHITGWRVGGGGASVNVYNGSSWTAGNYGVGAFGGTLGGQTIDAPMYCLDLFHSFHFNDRWQVEPIVVPPDPPNPPPLNTGEAAWIFNRYGNTTVAHQAQGVQLALWEVSHDQAWRTLFNRTNDDWTTTGNFRKNSGSLDNKWQHAKSILLDLFDTYRAEDAGNAVYLQPTPYQGNSYYGQGQLTALSEVPEPSTLVIVGLGLLGLGVARRKRRV